MLSRPSVLVFIVLAAGCAGAANPAPLEDPPLTGTATSRWVIGGYEDLGGVQLATPVPSHVAVGQTGRVLVLDEWAHGGVVVEPDGSVLSAFGRRGSGPGEFLLPRQGGFLSGDSVFWVSDITLHRISLFDVEGNFIRSHAAQPQPIAGGPWQTRPGAVLSDGVFLGSSTPRYDPASSHMPIVLWNAEGGFEVVDWLDRGPDLQLPMLTEEGLRIYPPRPFEASLLITVPGEGGGFSVIDRSPADGPRGEFSVRRYDTGGNRTASLTVAYRATPVTDSLRALVTNIATHFHSRYRERSPQIRIPSASVVEDAIWVPDYEPPIRVALEDSGGYWIMRERHSRRIERYSRDGLLVGALELPPGVGTIRGGSPEGFVGYRRDEFGVAELVFFDVTWEENS